MGSIIGVDEAGRGPVLGPMVIAGVRLPSETDSDQLKVLGVRDSKKCTPKRREYLSFEIRKRHEFSLKIISAEQIDKDRKKQTLNELEGAWFAEVINRLKPDHDTTLIVDSADANELTFKRYIESKIDIKCKVISKHKADEQYPVVAAASIVAKVERDAQVKRIGNELNVELGSGYPTDTVTIHFLEKWIKEKGNLPPHTRHSWKTAQRLLDEHQKPIKKLDEFD